MFAPIIEGAQPPEEQAQSGCDEVDADDAGQHHFAAPAPVPEKQRNAGDGAAAGQPQQRSWRGVPLAVAEAAERRIAKTFAVVDIAAQIGTLADFLLAKLLCLVEAAEDKADAVAASPEGVAVGVALSPRFAIAQEERIFAGRKLVEPGAAAARDRRASARAYDPQSNAAQAIAP